MWHFQDAVKSLSAHSTPTDGERTLITMTTSPRREGGNSLSLGRSLKGSLKPGSKRTHSGEIVSGTLELHSPVSSTTEAPFDRAVLIGSVFRIALFVSWYCMKLYDLMKKLCQHLVLPRFVERTCLLCKFFISLIPLYIN